MVALPNRATSGKVLLLMSTLLASGAAAEEAEVFIQAGAACRVRNGGFDHQKPEISPDMSMPQTGYLEDELKTEHELVQDPHF